jgi:hypothetical protein
MASKWAEDESDEEHHSDFIEERMITSLPKIDEPRSRIKKSSKKKKSREDREPEPSVSTKIVSSSVQPAEALVRVDGSTLSKKERKQKELDELDSIFNELGVDVTSAEA